MQNKGNRQYGERKRERGNDPFNKIIEICMQFGSIHRLMNGP